MISSDLSNMPTKINSNMIAAESDAVREDGGHHGIIGPMCIIFKYFEHAQRFTIHVENVRASAAQLAHSHRSSCVRVQSVY